MPRALTLQRTLVPRGDRARFFQKIARKRDHYQKANCKFWVFEEADLPGAFIEFYEAADIATLARAHAGAPDSIIDAARIYTEVEI